MTTKTKTRAPKSDSITWTYAEEMFSFLTSDWDVDAAKRIIAAKPRKIERIDTHVCEPFLSRRMATPGGGLTIRAGILTNSERVANDASIDLTIPLIVAHTKQGNALPIDGWHRVAKAVALGVEKLPVVYLTKAESKRVRL